MNFGDSGGIACWLIDDDAKDRLKARIAACLRKLPWIHRDAGRGAIIAEASVAVAMIQGSLKRAPGFQALRFDG